MKLSEEILNYIREHAKETKDLLVELAQIPAPSNHEQKRAEFCANWLKAQGARGVFIDDALNVVYPINCQGDGPVAVFMAHSDVVFPDTTPLPLREENGRIYCPGVGDDTANVAALLAVAKYLTVTGYQPVGKGVLLVINSGEEGLGNLKGCRKIMADYGDRIREFISFDGKNGRCVNVAVGSNRYEIEIETEGGHSFADFGNRNAIACMAEMICALYQIPVPKKGKTTFNVGTICGGTSVNTIAQSAKILYEFRSDERDSLKEMENRFFRLIHEFRESGVSVSVRLVGSRPCSGNVDPEAMGNLMKRAGEMMEDCYGEPIRFDSGSTDCNLPLAQGIPSLCLGCYYGEGSHTREEYVLADSLLPGLRLAFSLVLYHF